MKLDTIQHGAPYKELEERERHTVLALNRKMQDAAVKRARDKYDEEQADSEQRARMAREGNYGDFEKLGQELADSSALNTQQGGAHYKDLPIQPVSYIHANGIGFFEGNVIKYVSRWRAKGGIGDLEKAKHYIELLIELESKRPSLLGAPQCL